MKQSYHFLFILFLVCFTSKLYSQSVPSYVPTNGLVGWWGFNGNAQDGSGNGNHGTVNGATLTTDRFGNQNSAYSFDGQGNRINILNQLFNLGWQNYTISAWFQTSSLNNSNNPNNANIIFNTVPHNGIAITYYGSTNPFSPSVSNRISVLGGNGSGWNYFNYGTIVSNNTIPTHTWNHIVFTRIGSQFYLYINGRPSDSLTITTSQINQSSGLVFGNISNSLPSEGFLGRLDDFGLWNRSLNHQEILNLYNSEFTFQEIPIQNHFNFNFQNEGFVIPTGAVDLGGIPFALSTTGNNCWYSEIGQGGNPRSLNLNLTSNNVLDIFFLINSFWGTSGQPLAEIRLLFSDGTYQTKLLQGNQDIRDFNQGLHTNSINNTTTVNVFPTIPQLNIGGKRMDRLQMTVLDSNRTKILSNILIIDNGASYVQRVVLAGITLRRSNSASLIGGISFPNLSSCFSDTVTVPVNNGTLNGVANAALRMTYNADSLTYVGSSNQNPAFNGMVVNGGNGVVTLDWNTSTNQNFAAGNMVNLRFRVNGSSALTWDTLVYPSEFSDVNFNVVPQTFQSGGITNSTLRYTWQRQICQGQTLQMGGQTLSTGGNYQVVLPGSGTDCDTLVNLTLSVLPTQTSISATTCSNQPYGFDGQNLNLSGVYRDTLFNILGCDSVVTLNLTVRPAYSQTLAVVNCPGTSYNFGNQVLTTSGTYFNTFSTLGGCDSVVQLNLTFADSIRIVAQGGLNGFCPGGSLRIGTLSNFQQGTYLWKLNGNIIGTANADTLLVNQAGTYQAELVLSPTCTLYSNILTVSVLNCNQITGDLRYDNANLTPLAGVPVELKTLLGNVVAADTTDSSGNYSMSGYANGNYILDARIGYNSGGINSTDALLVNRYFTSLISLTPLRARAGDVNGNQITNSGDALLISRRITNLLSSFAVGNYVNDKPTINAQGNPLSVSMRALSTGDVNGSFIVQPSAPTLVLDTVYGNGPGSGLAVVRFINSTSGVFEKGVCWSIFPSPTILNNISVSESSGGFDFHQSFQGPMSGIIYIRAYARTSVGVFYSVERTFTPEIGVGCPNLPTLTDLDGNTYQTVQIGTQCWTQSNLKVSKYRNGDNIPTGLSNSAWQNSTAGAYAIYDNNPVNDGLYGKLYNHFAVTDLRGLCPVGWHVPTDGDWTTLENFLGGSVVAGGSLKSTATLPIPGGWNPPNTGSTNLVGFMAKPGGFNHIYAYFGALGQDGYWWSSTLTGTNASALRLSNNNYNSFLNANERTFGFSVRCLRDTLATFGSNLQLPTINTTAPLNITTTSALTGGLIVWDGGTPIVTRGVVYDTMQNSIISNFVTNVGSGMGLFTNILTGLIPSKQYYYRAFGTNSLGTSYGNQIQFETNDLAVGMSYEGGIVFYLDTVNRYGLMCAPSDQGYFRWGCYGTNINNTSSSIGSGATNTTSIVTNCSQRPIAASICSDLVLNGYSDWYLPSHDELEMMYLRLHQQGIGNFSNTAYYWSSTQISPEYAATVAFNNSGGNTYKQATNSVRAVRTFFY